jgi:hypothetical protein
MDPFWLKLLQVTVDIAVTTYLIYGVVGLNKRLVALEKKHPYPTSDRLPPRLNVRKGERLIPAISPKIGRDKPVTEVPANSIIHESVFNETERFDASQLLVHANQFLEDAEKRVTRLQAAVQLHHYLLSSGLLEPSCKNITAGQCSTIERLLKDGVIKHRGKDTGNHRFTLEMSIPPDMMPHWLSFLNRTYATERTWQVVD